MPDQALAEPHPGSTGIRAPSTHTTDRRKLGLHHFAFYRGHLEGMDLTDLGRRYLETGDDRVAAKRTVRWIRDRLISAARRQAQPAIARLLKIPIGKLPTDSGVQAMSLEDFQAERDPDGFYTESELIELFENEVSSGDPVARRKSQRNERLRKKLRQAISWLESFVATQPTLDDPLSAWFDEALTGRLANHGVESIRDLSDLIGDRGHRWHRKIAKLGAIGARGIEAWLRQFGFVGDETSLAVPCDKLRAPEKRLGIVPFERLALSGALSGVTGDNRNYGCKMAATDDWQAIHAWLQSLGDRPHTLRSYRTQAERFLLWVIFELGKPMSSATVEDCTGYRDFLAALDEGALWHWHTPRSDWVGARSTPRWSKDWRPFAGALSPSSQKQAVVILTAMFEWLLRQRYLETNPWDGVPPLLCATPKIRADHSLSRRQWQGVLHCCEELPRDEVYFRLRFALLLGYGAGLRRDEMASLKVARRQVRSGELNPGLTALPDDAGWEVEVIGKGRKLRQVPLSDVVLEALQDYMECRGLGRDPGSWPETTPLIATLPYGFQFAVVSNGGRQALSDGALYRLFKRHFARTARLMDRASDAGHLLQASTHWLRHTHATHSLEAGATLDEVQENLGHASPATTAIYSHANKKRRQSAVNKLMEYCS